MKRIFKIVAMAPFLLAMSAAIPAMAEEPKEMAKPDLTGEILEEPMAAGFVRDQDNATAVKEGEADWFVNMDYAGFDFELPAGMIVEKGQNFSAKYPDGTFGLSMSNQTMKGANQGTAYEVCRRLAAELRLPVQNVEKVSFGKCHGARATGVMEGQNVTLMVLPYSGEQATTVMLCTPGRQEWADHFMNTLKR